MDSLDVKATVLVGFKRCECASARSTAPEDWGKTDSFVYKTFSFIIAIEHVGRHI